MLRFGAVEGVPAKDSKTHPPLVRVKKVRCVRREEEGCKKKKKGPQGRI